jgi:hypothetical protein
VLDVTVPEIGLQRPHGTENAHDEVKCMVLQLVQVGRIAFLELAIREALLLRTLVPSLN